MLSGHKHAGGPSRRTGDHVPIRSLPSAARGPCCRDKVADGQPRAGGYLPDPAAFTAAAGQAASRRSACIISARLADKTISVVTANAPDRYAAAAVARAIVSGGLKRQALSFSQQALAPIIAPRFAAIVPLSSSPEDSRPPGPLIYGVQHGSRRTPEHRAEPGFRDRRTSARARRNNTAPPVPAGLPARTPVPPHDPSPPVGIPTRLRTGAGRRA